MSENNGWGVPNPPQYPQEPQNGNENSQVNYQNAQPQYTQDTGTYQQGQYPQNENNAYQQGQYPQNNGYYQQQYQTQYQQPQQNWDSSLRKIGAASRATTMPVMQRYFGYL